MSDWIEQLERLSALRAAGHMTEAQFEAAKAKVIGVSPVATSLTAEEQAPDHQAEATEDADLAKGGQVGEAADPSEWQYYEEPTLADALKSRLRMALPIILLMAIVAMAGWYFLGDSAVAETLRSARVEQSDLNCRMEANLDSPVREQITRGTDIQIGEAVDGWVHVPSRECWVKENRLAVRTMTPPVSVDAPVGKTDDRMAGASPSRTELDSSTSRPPSCSQAFNGAVLGTCVSTMARTFPLEPGVNAANRTLSSTSLTRLRTCPTPTHDPVMVGQQLALSLYKGVAEQAHLVSDSTQLGKIAAMSCIEHITTAINGVP